MSKTLTKWEAGNLIVKAIDQLSEIKIELKDYPELQKSVVNARQLLLDKFYEQKLEDEMGFGVLDEGSK